jgi:hypothetical protein
MREGFLVINYGESEGVVRLADGSFRTLVSGEEVRLDARPLSHSRQVKAVPTVMEDEPSAVPGAEKKVASGKPAVGNSEGV